MDRSGRGEHVPLPHVPALAILTASVGKNSVPLSTPTVFVRLAAFSALLSSVSPFGPPLR
jgi:hypothetical protein